jgi:uncharacterized protein
MKAARLMGRRGGEGGSRMGQLFEGLLILSLIAALLAGAVWATLLFMQPAPPKSLIISAATKGAPYHRAAERYQAILARNGIKLEVRESQGSLDNLKALQDPASGVQAGFLQGGIIHGQEAAGFKSLGRIFHEPLWVFYRGADTIDKLSQLKGKRILVGPKGGGTNNLAVRLLASSKVTPDNATFIDTMSLPDYVEALDKGQADAGFLVLAPDARTIQRLMALPNLRLMSFSQSEGLTRMFPFLARVTLPQGVVDFEANNPPEDTHMVSTTAALVVRDDLHPALVNVLTQAVIETHGGVVQGPMAMFQKVGEFPQIPDPEFAVAPDATRVYKSGPPILQRYMPFWLANLFERLLLMLVPALTIVLPLMKVIPALYRWRIRRRILFWYSQLKGLERDIYAKPGSADAPVHMAEIERIDEGITNLRVPLAFSDQLYNLRDHLDIVRRRLAGRGGVVGVGAGVGTGLAS